MKKSYDNSVFINCPIDDEYRPLFHAMVFTVLSCGFHPRCALEEDDSGKLRFEKITRLISESKFGLHDISRIELDAGSGYPRFNMPFELGVFLGAARFSDARQGAKNTLILDSQPYRYQEFLSDIAGQDIRAHASCARKVVGHIRDWLNATTGRKTIPGGAAIHKRYEAFCVELPQVCKTMEMHIDEMTYKDFSNFAAEWLREQ